jgi:hypothetical protein
LKRFGQIGDNSAETDRFSPVAIDKTTILFGKSIYKISAGGYYDGSFNNGHACAIFSSSLSCFFILNNDSNVCRGNGKRII